jgi:hypothetical protein
MEVNFGGGFFNMEVNSGGELNTEVNFGGKEFLLHGGELFSTQKQNLLISVVVLQKGEESLRLVNYGVRICARSFNHPNGISQLQCCFLKILNLRTILRDCR